ncbi:MAG TPA: CBS domain-containing protein [Geobacteraceae bacterium]
MKASDIMITDVPIISLNASVAEAVKILRKNFGDESYLNAAPGLVVVNDKGEVAGILSPLTIMKALLDARPHTDVSSASGAAFYEQLCTSIKDKTVEEIMDWQAISVTEEALLVDVAELFVKNRFQRVPVVKDNKVVGIIYRSRLLFAMAASLLD